MISTYVTESVGFQVLNSEEANIAVLWLRARGRKQSFEKCTHMGLEHGTGIQHIELED